MEPLQIIGLKQLDEDEQQVVNKLSNNYYIKIQRLIKNATSLQVHIKVHSKGGKKRFEVKIRALAPIRIFESYMEDWDLAKCLHIAFEELQHEISHKLPERK